MKEKIDDREWLAQQVAIHRDPHTRSDAEDSRARSYRLIARALRERKPHDLPRDFAERVAARANAERSSSFESVLMIALIGALGICAATVVARYGGEWAPAFDAGGWLLVCAGCAGASWLLEQWQRRAR